jgi:predicted lipoprotein with Yx(FWY)xxD motif
MKSQLKWFGALAAMVLLAATAAAADAVAIGKVKEVNADKKTVVLTEANGKDYTFKLDEHAVINRGGKESKSDLNAGEAVNILFDKGLTSSTARYVLVQEGDSKNWELVHGAFKSYDTDKKQFCITDANGKDVNFAMGDAKVRLNKEAGKVQDIRIGDKTLVIIEKAGDKSTLKSVMIERK